MLTDCEGFEWDEGNLRKNWIKNRVSRGECEQVFFNHPLILSEDEKHSRQEKQQALLAQTDAGRWLTVIFTIRVRKIRVISARDMSRKERRFYAEATSRLQK